MKNNMKNVRIKKAILAGVVAMMTAMTTTVYSDFGSMNHADAVARKTVAEFLSSSSVVRLAPGCSVDGRFKVTAIMEIIQNGETVPMVGIIDLSNGNSATLTLRKKYDSLRLLAADSDKQEVILQLNDKTFAVTMGSWSSDLPPAIENLLRRPGVFGKPNPREENAMALRRARYAQPPPAAPESNTP